MKQNINEKNEAIICAGEKWGWILNLRSFHMEASPMQLLIHPFWWHKVLSYTVYCLSNNIWAIIPWEKELMFKKAQPVLKAWVLFF